MPSPTDLTAYRLGDGVATITMDDGKANALSTAMLAAIAGRLDQARADEAAAVVLTGRERTFSAGFDLKTPPEGWQAMLIAGAELALTLLEFPRPVVLACTGNAIAMGAFLLLSGDHRIGTDADARIGLNEVAIGLTVPWFGIALARHRLIPPAFQHCLTTGALLPPDDARAAGFLDDLVAPADLSDAANTAAMRLASVNLDAHAATKLRIRAQLCAELREGIQSLHGDPAGW